MSIRYIDQKDNNTVSIVPKKATMLMANHFHGGHLCIDTIGYSAATTEKKDMADTRSPSTTQSLVLFPQGRQSTHEASEWCHSVSLTQKIVGLDGSGM